MKKFIFRLLAPALAALFMAQGAFAACVGLDRPVPQNTNVCETLTERLVIPRTEAFCDIPDWARIVLPHCNLPAACHVDPVCMAFEATREIEALVFNAGDLYCDFREISPEEMITKIGNGAFSDLVTLTTGGTSSILYQTANRHLDMMSCAGVQLKSQVKQRINCATANSDLPPERYFSAVDLNRVTIVSELHPTAQLYLQDGYAAITLNDLVIMRHGEFQTLKNWHKSGSDSLTEEEVDALVLMIHELVHVRQYRNRGKEAFLNTYLAEALVSGYPDISMEREAESFEEWSRPHIEAGCVPTVAMDRGPLRETLRSGEAERLGAAVRVAENNRIAIATAQREVSRTITAPSAPTRSTPSVTVRNARPEMINSGIKLSVLDPKTCYNAVQGKIAWDHQGSTGWSATNVENLCRGNETSLQPAACFDNVMHKAKWPDDQKWHWRSASAVCQGASNAADTIECVYDALNRGQSRETAVNRCKGR